MQTPVCPLCKSQDNEERFLKTGYRVFVCHVCELFFINPYPTNSDQVHHRVSEDNYGEIDIIDSTKQYRSEVEFYKRYFSLIALECEGARFMLDVGCGTGHLLERLSIYPDLFRVGIELNIARAEMARKVSGCEIHQVPIEKFSSATKFDVITMIHVLSHIPSFDSLFNSIRSLLPKNGKLVLKVWEMRKDVKKGDMWDWQIPDHLHFLGLNAIDFICRKYGFRIDKRHRIPYSDELFSLHRWKAPGRSAVRNIIKQIVVHIPFTLPVLARCYEMVHGRRIYTSLIVLSSQS